MGLSAIEEEEVELEAAGEDNACIFAVIYNFGGPKGQYVVSRVRALLVSVAHQNLRSAIYSCQVLCIHVFAMAPGQRVMAAKSCKGKTRVPDALIGTYQLRERTLTENPRSSKAAEVGR
jgi:negative regulator of replication initiation